MTSECEHSGEFIVTGGDTAEVFESCEEAFDAVSVGWSTAGFERLLTFTAVGGISLFLAHSCGWHRYHSLCP